MSARPFGPLPSRRLCWLLFTLWFAQGCQDDSSGSGADAIFRASPSSQVGAEAGGDAASAGGTTSTAGPQSDGTHLAAGVTEAAAGTLGSGGTVGLDPKPSSGGTSTSGAGVTGAAPGGGAAGRSHGGGAGASGGRDVAETCAGREGALRGSSTRTLTVDGVQRSFIYYAPAELDPTSAAPVVIVAHGWLMSGQAMVDITHYQELADREGFVAIFPEGQPLSVGPWNVGDGACPSNLGLLPLATGDDQAFIDAMVAFTEADRCVDRRHVFVTGFSMGGYFSNETGCLHADVAAIAAHSGGSHDLSACPVKQKPVLLLHGTMDGLIPVTCGTEARDRWVEHNGCSSEVDIVDVLGGHCEYSRACPEGGQVALCLFDGMDHGWAGGDGAFGFPGFESATELSWAFFRRFAWD